MAQHPDAWRSLGRQGSLARMVPLPGNSHGLRTFLGLREDKTAREVVREIPEQAKGRQLSSGAAFADRNARLRGKGSRELACETVRRRRVRPVSLRHKNSSSLTPAIGVNGRSHEQRSQLHQSRPGAALSGLLAAVAGAALRRDSHHRRGPAACLSAGWLAIIWFAPRCEGRLIRSIWSSFGDGPAKSALRSSARIGPPPSRASSD